jgi:LAGLIDADG DNA endonuclease family
VSDSAVYYWRKKLGLKSKFSYDKIRKIDKVTVENLFNLGYSDYKIAKILNCSPDGIYSHRMRYKLFRNDDLRFNKPLKLTDFQKQVLIGTLLGDSSMRKGGDIKCSHGIKQKEYCLHKTEIFKSLNSKCLYHKRSKTDKRNGNIYEDYTMYIGANSYLSTWYYKLYVGGTKVIPFDLLEHFTEVSLAFMFMDDGSRCNSGYTIATNCFNKDELIEFQKFLLYKFNLIHSQNLFLHT